MVVSAIALLLMLGVLGVADAAVRDAVVSSLEPPVTGRSRHERGDRIGR
jgi:hypothetical protein